MILGSRRALAAVAVAALAACGNAAPEPSVGELLLANPPAGWEETAALQTPVLRMAEYGPPGSSDDAAPPAADEAAAAIERVTFEAQGGSPLPDPIDFVLGVSRDLASRCPALDDVNVSSGLENGYRTSVRLTICPRFSELEQGEIAMVKAIQGNERFYVVSRRLRVPPITGDATPLTAQDMAEWTTYFRRITLCDTRTEAHPCPAQAAPGAPASAQTPPPESP